MFWAERKGTQPEESGLSWIQSMYLIWLAASYLNAAEVGNGLFKQTIESSLEGIGEHSLMAGAYAEIVATALGLPDQSVNKVVVACLLHDAGKPYERLRGEKNSDFLRRFDVSEEIITLTEAVKPKNSQGPQTDEEKVVWFVDAMLDGVEAVTIKDRMKAGERRNPELMHTRYENHQTLYQVQLAIGDRLSREFVKRLSLNLKPHVLPKYLHLQLLQKMINFNYESAAQQFLSSFSESGNDPNKGLLLVFFIDKYLSRFTGRSLFEPY